MRFRAEQHLRRQGDFRAVREHGRRLHCGAFTLTWLRRDPPAGTDARVGVVASTAAVGNAIQRNRAKRRLRELFRRHQQLVPAGCDLVLTARSSLNRTAFPELERKFADACRQISLVAS
ncbi:MAG TPA: ribonuclease P protein component [Opitutus sp.]|nr:ribonuclease P protein component [Opitutus sp.]